MHGSLFNFKASGSERVSVGIVQQVPVSQTPKIDTNACFIQNACSSALEGAHLFIGLQQEVYRVLRICM